MQIRKYYGRTASEALMQVKKALGSDALILETRRLEPGNPAARANRPARYEICAAREESPSASMKNAYARGMRDAASERVAPGPGVPKPTKPTRANRPVVNRGRSVIEDLAVLRSQIEQLLDPHGSGSGANDHERAVTARVDLSDYHALIEQGVDHQVLAPHFRRWLNWRTSSGPVRRWLAEVDEGPIGQMQTESLREWLWRVWMDSMGLDAQTDGCESDGSGVQGQVVGFVGPTGVGKTTTIAKISSKMRQENRQNPVVITLDTFRFGATEQWKKISNLTGVPVVPIVTQEELRLCMEKWDRYDWVGIDTPGGMTLDCPAGRLYGSILAQSPVIETKLVLPATRQEADSRDQMARSQAILGANKVLFSKLDESNRKGSLVNLTLDSRWKIDGFTTGQRVPEDWEPADGQALWNHIIAPNGEGHNVGGTV